MNEENLREKIVESIQPEYKRNMKNLHDLVYDQPITSLEKAMFWIEYVIRHKGAKHLAFTAKTVPIHQTYCLDFIAIFIMLFISTTYVSWKILAKLFKSFASRKKSKKD
jgi:glucuronosyltransferase